MSPVRTECQSVNRIIGLLQMPHERSRDRVPDLDVSIVAAGSKQATSRMERHGKGEMTVLAE